MAHVEQLTASVRQRVGSADSRRLRRRHLLPGSLYGHGEPAVSLAASTEQIEAIVHSGHRIVDLDLDGKTEQTLLKEIQWDAFGHQILHFDLLRVSAKEKIVVEVPVVTHGTAPGVVAGGVLDLALHSLQVECVPANVPDEIGINVNQMEIGATLRVADLELPPGVTVAELDPDEAVVNVVPPGALAAEEPEEEEIVGAAEPELVRREREQEEPEGEG